jgi:ankyrin repeat protein
MAAHTGRLEIINCLLKAGADPNAPEEVSLYYSLHFST